MFHGGTAQLITDWESAAALCPLSLPAAKASALGKAHACFRGVPERRRFTVYWLECCVQMGRLLAPTPGAPCYCPLPHVLPLPGMEDVR